MAVTTVAAAGLIAGLFSEVAPRTVTGTGAGVSLLCYSILMLVGPLHRPTRRSAPGVTGRDQFSRAGNSPVPVTTLVVVAASTVVVSVAALLNGPLMRLMTRDLTQLRAGQWWRVASPVLVQPSGSSQLAYNVIGLVVVGATLELQVRRAAWLLVHLVGCAGSIAAASAWKPTDTGGGSSDAVAALVGALAGRHRDRLARPGAPHRSDLVVTRGSDDRAAVGWISVGIVAAMS